MEIPENHIPVFALCNRDGDSRILANGTRPSENLYLYLAGWQHNDHPTYQDAEPPTRYLNVETGRYVTDPADATVAVWAQE